MNCKLKGNSAGASHISLERIILYSSNLETPKDYKTKVSTGHGTSTGSKLRKENIKAVYRHLGYLTDMQSTSSKCWTGIKIAGKNNNNLTCRLHNLYFRKRRGIKEPLDESERGEWKSWLKAQHSEN